MAGKCANFGVQSLQELCVFNRSGTPGQSGLSPLHLRRHAVPGLLCCQLPSQHYAAEDPGLPAVLQVGSNLFLHFSLSSVCLLLMLFKGEGHLEFGAWKSDMKSAKCLNALVYMV